MDKSKEELSDLKTRHETLIQQTLTGDPSISRGCASLMAARLMLKQAKEEVFGNFIVDQPLKAQGGR